ncbi:hypothetical protein SO802_022082 [Lithocarpus litseifolius]|uniref:Uncharacterized protein n=1 Tax=Lithocarpus litseifolius TaxID=425828 RepID=A0AAW2CGR8_9ROSI
MDSSSLFEANQASSQPSLTEDNIGMKPKYYNAAAKGKIEVFQGITEPLNQLLTPNRNTVLHIHLTSLIKGSESSTAFVKEILKMYPLLLWQANVKGETPLHIAVRYGHAPIVEVLIVCAKSLHEDLESGVNKTVKEMLEMTNNEKDTAFHEAVRGNHLHVLKLLIQEGPDISFSQNDAGETPLYIAVDRDFEEVAFHILETCTSPAHDGPLGRTTLRTAVIRHNEDLNRSLCVYGERYGFGGVRVAILGSDGSQARVRLRNEGAIEARN